MSMSFKASPDGTYGEILVNGQAVAKLPVTGNAVIPNLVGTVSQSGGVPTGAVVERGSNANGEYVRFADGTQICTGSIVSSPTWTSTELGFRYSGPASATFASAFANNPTCCPMPKDANVAGRASWVTFVETTPTSISSLYMASTSGSTGSTSMSLQYAAIGRWY